MLKIKTLMKKDLDFLADKTWLHTQALNIIYIYIFFLRNVYYFKCYFQKKSQILCFFYAVYEVCLVLNIDDTYIKLVYKK